MALHERRQRPSWPCTGRRRAEAARSRCWDVHEKILDVAAAFDIVFWPCVMDPKVRDVERMADASIDVCLFNGGIRTSEQEYMARSASRQGQGPGGLRLLCAYEGCIPGLANAARTARTIFRHGLSRLAVNRQSGPTWIVPQTVTRRSPTAARLHLPEFYDTLKTLGQTVEVDYFLPGCPPEADRVWDALVAIMEGQLPQVGSVIGADTTVCEECSRTRKEKKIRAFKRTWEVIPDSETCLLEQGLLCCGIATRAGCGALCPRVNSPCIGCYGPNTDVHDFGARMIAALASVIDSEDPEEVERIVQEGIPARAAVPGRADPQRPLGRRLQSRAERCGRELLSLLLRQPNALRPTR